MIKDKFGHDLAQLIVNNVETLDDLDFVKNCFDSIMPVVRDQVIVLENISG